jgi:hypothetical protein
LLEERYCQSGSNVCPYNICDLLAAPKSILWLSV